MDATLQSYATQLDRALRDARELRGRLFDEHGQSRYVPAEFQRQEAGILAPLRDKAAEVAERAAEVEAEAAAELEALGRVDPLQLVAGLPADELRRAADLAVFVRMLADAPEAPDAGALFVGVDGAGAAPTGAGRAADAP